MRSDDQMPGLGLCLTGILLVQCVWCLLLDGGGGVPVALQQGTFSTGAVQSLSGPLGHVDAYT